MSMSRRSKALVVAADAALFAGLALAAPALPGCGGPEEIPAGKAAAIPVHNPSADNPLKDVTLENEYQHKNKIPSANMK
jgi:hypothetical protein